MKKSSMAKWRSHLRDFKILSQSPLFDKEFFRTQADLPPHKSAMWEYLRNWQTHRQPPSPFFDQHHYLSTNPDVQTARINPLMHYLRHGWAERRSPLPNFNFSEFFAAHPELADTSVEPISYCLERYGRPHWQSHLARWLIRRPSEYSRQQLSEARALFDADFYTSMYGKAGEKIGDPFMHYLAVGTRLDHNPFPGFDNAFYHANNMRPGVDLDAPLIHYVTTGKSAGVRTSETGFHVFDQDPVDTKTNHNILVHAHLYYPELILEFLPGFRNFPSETQFVITTCREADAGMIRAAMENAEFERPCDVLVVSNQGRDILPFFKVLEKYHSQADFVLHVHSKVSPHIKWGEAWRHYLIEMTMGSPQIIGNALKTLAAQDSKTGCLFPENYHQIKVFLAEENNSATLTTLMDQYGITAAEEDGVFPASSFAWYRAKALKPLIDRRYTDEDFDVEGGQVDGTLAHAFERFLPMIVRHQGFTADSYSTTRRPDLGLDKITLPTREPSGAEVSGAWLRDTPAAAKEPPKPLAPLYNVFNSKHLDIHWIIPSFAMGAGGHMSIFRIVAYLEKFGHHQTIWVQNAYNHPDEESARKRIQAWYQPIGDRVAVRFLPEDVEGITGDILIATDAWTAFPAAQMPGFLERFYFIQDVESQFHPTGENQLVIDQTYGFGFAALTAGPWLKSFAQSHGMWVKDWPLCADFSVYAPPLVKAERRPSAPLRIAFYARQYTPRRAVKLGYSAFEELKRRGVKFHVYLFGEEDLGDTGDFPQTKLGILTPEELAQLYCDSDIGVVFSTTNYSLLPLEMAACGLPVVDLDVDSMRAVFSGDEITLAQPTPYGVADAIEELINNPDLMTQRRDRALEMAKAQTWEDSARLIETGLVERLTERGYKDLSDVVVSQIGSPALAKPAKVSVLIPSYNAGEAFRPVLEMVCKQNLDVPYDVIVIDSSSSDGTPDLVKTFGKAPGEAKEVRLISIDQSEFQHGATRNRGIEESSGSHVAILTQDAKPANEAWLAQLLSGFAQGDRVAGVIGRHIAYPEHGAFIQRDMENHFSAIQSLGSCLTRSDGLPSLYYPMSPAWQMLLYFYSDNNSAIAKAVWERCPYPEIDWGEDYVWARKMMNMGWQKAYVHSSVVYHSHDFEGAKTTSAAEAEGRFWKTHFGFTLHRDPKADIAAALQRDEAFAMKANLSHDAMDLREKFIRAQVAGRVKGTKRTRKAK